MKKNWRNKVAMGLSAVMVMGALGRLRRRRKQRNDKGCR